ncbi:T9SS type A sorting domain-containing protein [Fluviicola chungangensis]|uniref:T9SS type A sorting domain-containing protein n=1 Tax=Fluviicola chungangensis TaxID=2597671 RepID=A0A556N826_9FLAO|nr:T9SS type A sorting domain-containing protein [Fluviicola chungangensis]TSJ48169.1 T9SS type A sorting domain-containing protein [Fluviicola chungangensis]
MKKIGIEKPCSENWNNMNPTEKGAFCQKCAKQVYDFSNQSLQEIKLTLLEFRGQSLCVRMTVTQDEELNAEFKLWLAKKRRNPQQLFIAALLIVFGLTLFSCQDKRDQQTIQSVQEIAYNIASGQADKLEPVTVQEEFIAPLAPPELIEYENYIMGAYPAPVVYDMPPQVPEIVEPEVHLLGDASENTSVMRFLQETTDVELDENGVPFPTEFKALAFPNPAVENTTLEIQAPEKERMQVNLYDTSGKFIREIHSGKVARGTFRQPIDLNDLSSGLYLIIIQSKEFKETVRVIKN